LIFAGADLSDAPGWMEGAVRSADQALAALLG
jgi:monoamine oxidase